MALKSTYPGVSALVAVLYRSGAVKNGGPVVALSDPFGAWVEACSSVGLACVTYVGPARSTHIQDRIWKIWTPDE